MNNGNRGGAGDRMNSGGRANSGDRMNSGNRINTGDRNSGNRINTGDINIDRGDWNIDVDPGYGVRPGWGNGGYPIGAGLVMGAAIGTAIAVGSMYYSVPAGCPIVHTYAVPYYHCGGHYYRQEMQGDDVVYVVVTP
jgi:hypothetical protein